MFHNFSLTVFFTLGEDGAYLAKFVPKDGPSVFNDTGERCKTSTTPVEFASDGNHRPTRSDRGVWNANRLDKMSED